MKFDANSIIICLTFEMQEIESILSVETFTAKNSGK